MSKLIEIAAFALGGLSVLAVCFLGFALASDVPLHEMAIIGKMFTPEEEAAPSSLEEPETSPAALVTEQEAIQSSVGILGTWRLPSPYDQDELLALSNELKGQKRALELRETDLERRETEVAEQLSLLDERFKTIEELRRRLETKEAELALREQEVARDEGTAVANNKRRVTDLAELLGGLEGTDAVAFLSEFSADETAAILRQMDSERAGELLLALRTAKTPEEWSSVLHAWTEYGALDE